MDRHYVFHGPDGKRVDVEMRYDLKLLHPGSAEEPADFGVRSSLYVNEVPVDPQRYPALVNFLEDFGGCR